MSPFNFDSFMYIYVILLSVFAGTAYHIKKIKDGVIDKFRLSEWFGDAFISSFIGFLTYQLVLYFSIDMALGSFLIGVSAHQGTRVILLYEDLFNTQIDRFFNVRK